MSNNKIEEQAELKEKLAAIEHVRWSNWQKWLHSRLRSEKVLLPEDMTYVETGNMVMSKSDYERWQRQINTPYSQLSDDEKRSDKEQVDRYWPLIEAYLAKQKESLEKEARIAEVQLMPPMFGPYKSERIAHLSSKETKE